MILANLSLLSLSNFWISSINSITLNKLKISDVGMNKLLHENVNLHKNEETEILSITQFKGFANEKKELNFSYKIVVITLVLLDIICFAFFSFVFVNAKKVDKKNEDSVIRIPIFADDI